MAKSRKSSRKNRRSSRRANRAGCGMGRCYSRRNRRQAGGMAPLDDKSMAGAGQLSLAQGTEYAKMHAGQHGGAAVSLVNSAPVGFTGMLDDSLRGAARVGVLDDAVNTATAAGQSGGRRRGSRRGRKGSKKSRKSRKGRKGSRKGSRKSRRSRRSSRSSRMNAMRGMMGMYGGKRGSRRNGMLNRFRKMLGMSGGAYSLAAAADYGAPGMLLSPGEEAKALGGMNPEWKLATDPNSFAPRS